MICVVAAVLLGLSLAEAAILPGRSDHTSARSLGGKWYHRDDHPAHALFKRQSVPSDGVNYPAIGSKEWLSAYPQGLPDTSKLPQEWVNALNTAVAAGKIPNLAPSKNNPAGIPTYGNLKPTSPQVCSGTYQCQIAGDIWAAPDGFLGCGVCHLFLASIVTYYVIGPDVYPF
jgi:chitin deacetylase